MEKLKKILDLSHSVITYKIDFPHLAAPLATSENSGWWKETLKFIAGLSPLNLVGESPSDVFFMSNSMTGDLLTHINDKDAKTNIDAYIFRYHPQFKDLLLDDRIEKYYSIDNLDIKRTEYYRQVLKLRGGGNTEKDYADFINWGSAVSIAGVALILINFGRKELEEFNNSNLSTYFNKKIWTPIKKGGIAFIKNPLGFIGNRILYPISNLAADVLVIGGSLLK